MNKKTPTALLFARCACPRVHWAVRGCYIGCRECLERGAEAEGDFKQRRGYFQTYVVLTFRPRQVRKEIDAATSEADIAAIIERENATLPRGRAA